MRHSLLRHHLQKEIFLKINIYRKNILYWKKKITEEETNLHHKIELLTSIGANVDVNVNQWRHLLKVSAYCFG